MIKKYILPSLISIVFLSFINSSEVIAADATKDSLKQCSTKICKDLFKQYKKYARKRHSSAMYVLGEFYYHGYGTKVDKERALRFYRKASIYDFRQAQFKAGSMFFYDPEFMDKEKGITYLKEAARNKHAHAAYALGIIFSGDQMGKSDYQQADKWLAIAIDEKHKRAIEYAQKLQTAAEFSVENYPQISQQLAEIAKEQTQKEKALQENSQIEPGCWSLGQVSTTPYYAKQHKGTGIELELFNLLPVPNVDTPLADILEFKEKRNDELVAFRCYLDEINEKILSSIDVPRAKNAELNRLELSLKDIDRTMSESGIGKVVSNFKHVINTDLSGIIGVGLGAAGLASFVPMSPMVAGLSSAGLVTTVRSLMVSNHSKYGDLTYLKSVRQCF